VTLGEQNSEINSFQLFFYALINLGARQTLHTQTNANYQTRHDGGKVRNPEHQTKPAQVRRNTADIFPARVLPFSLFQSSNHPQQSTLTLPEAPNKQTISPVR
jgi:hypothetical protein